METIVGGMTRSFKMRILDPGTRALRPSLVGRS